MDTSPPRRSLRVLFGVFFVVAGGLHFLRAEFFASIVPPYLPWPLALVYISGLTEMLLGLLLMWRRWAALAAWGLIALLVAVFPANIHMAINPQLYPTMAPTMLWVRLLFQPLMMLWAYRYTRRV